MRGIKGRSAATAPASGPDVGGSPPPPPPPFATAAIAAAGVDGPTGFAFPEPLPDEALEVSRPGPAKRGRQEIALKDVLIVLGAIAVVVAVRLATGGPRTAYGLGQSFGAGFLGVLLAYGGRQLYLRKSGNGGPAWSLSMVPIAVILGLVGQFTLVGTSTPAPDRAAVQATLVPLEGFEYQAAPAAVVEELETFLADLPEIGDKMGGVEARMVHRGGTMAGVVVVVGVQPDELRDMDRDSFRAGLQMSAGAEVVERKRGKARTYETKLAQFYSVTFVDEEGYVFTVQGLGKRTAVDISKHLAAANL